MEIREVEAFVVVARCGNFTRAADELSLSQPAVTRQVASLERSVGAKLLDRMGRRIALTSAGQVLLPYATEMLRLMSDARKAVGDVARGATGRLAIGASSTAATYLLPPMLREFSDSYPNVHLSMLTGPTGRVAELVASNTVDVGVVMDFRPRADMIARIVGDYKLVLIADPSHPLAGCGAVDATVLAGLPLIVMPPGATLRRHVEALALEAGIEFPVAMELDNVEAIKKMVEAKLGVSIVPDVAVAGEVSGETLAARPLSDYAAAKQQIAAIYRPDKYVSSAMNAFIEQLSMLRGN